MRQDKNKVLLLLLIINFIRVASSALVYVAETAVEKVVKLAQALELC